MLRLGKTFRRVGILLVVKFGIKYLVWRLGVTTKRVPENSLLFKNSKTKLKNKTMNYCIIFENQKIAIEIPVSSDSNIRKAKRYICDNFLQFSEVDPSHGLRVLKEDVDYTKVSNAIKWGYTILPL